MGMVTAAGRVFFGIALLLTACATPTTAPVVPEVPTPAPPVVEEPPPKPSPHTPPPPVYARILAVGDLLMHTPLVYSSQLPDGDFDFTPLFEPVRVYIQRADLAIANLETTLTGDQYPWAGYPSFNTPPQFARDLKKLGFDVIVHANNHTLDYDHYGLLQTSAALEEAGLHRTGGNRSQEEQDRILVVDVAPSIKMAVLNYTYGTNGIPLPDPWSVNMLDPERIPADIRRARSIPDVDLVAVALHMGDEYARAPNQEQQFYVDLCLNAGADIILGNHPHVIQPMETRMMTDEHGRHARRAAIYSLGNFISNQIGLHREAGLMMLIDVKKEDGVTTVEQVGFVPTWVHPYVDSQGVKRYRVVAVEQAMADYEAGRDSLITAADYQRLKEVRADTTVQAVGSSDIRLISQP